MWSRLLMGAAVVEAALAVLVMLLLGLGPGQGAPIRQLPNDTNAFRSFPFLVGSSYPS